MNENACQGFEIAIEMRRHGAADPEASRLLDEHLRDCAGCRAYEKLGADSEAGLRSDAEDATAKADLERLRARGRRIVGGAWSDIGAFSLLLAFALLTRLMLGGYGLDPSIAALQAILFFAWPFVLLRRSRRELEEAWSSDTLFYALRKDVVTRLRASSTMAVASTLMALFFFVDRASGGGMFPGGVARGVFAACFGALGVLVLAVRVPRLLRERREIPLVPDPYRHSSDSPIGLL